MQMTVPNTHVRQRVLVFSIGSMALGYLLRSNKWEVIATFKRSFYCRDNRSNIICIGQKEIGKGPFTLLCSSNSPWPAHALSTIRQIQVLNNQLLFEGKGISFDLHGALVWNKSLRTISGQDDHLLTDIYWIAGKVFREAPLESLGLVVASFFPLKIPRTRLSSDILTDSLHKRFVGVISKISHLPVQLHGGQYNSSLAEGLERLIGLGPGLTPSGDDFLAGVVMGLYKTGREDEAAWLANFFYRTAQTRVTDISLAFYRALSEGLVAEPYLQFLKAIGTGEALSLERLLNRVSLHGATSGWDTITGMLFGFRLGLSKQNKNHSQTMEAAC